MHRIVIIYSSGQPYHSMDSESSSSSVLIAVAIVAVVAAAVVGKITMPIFDIQCAETLFVVGTLYLARFMCVYAWEVL